MVTFFCPVLVSVIWELTVPTLLPPRWIWNCLSPPAGPWPSRTVKHSCTHTLAGTRTGRVPCRPRSCHGSRHPWGIVSRSPPPRSRRTSSAQLALVSWLNHHHHPHRQSHLRWHMLAWSNPRYPTATHRLRDIGEPFCDHHFLLDGKLVRWIWNILEQSARRWTTCCLQFPFKSKDLRLRAWSKVRRPCRTQQFGNWSPHWGAFRRTASAIYCTWPSMKWS